MKRTVLVFILCAVIMAVLTGLGFLNIPYKQIVYSLISCVMFMGFSLLLKGCNSSLKARKFFLFSGLKFRDFFVVSWSAIILITGSFIINYALSSLCDIIGVSPVAGSSLSSVTSKNYILMVIVIAIIPAILEELFFRGAVFSFLKQKSVTYAVIMSALFFTLVHGFDYYFLSTFFAGIILATIVNITNSIYSAMVIHFINNIMSYVLSIYSERLESVRMDIYLLYALGLLLMVSTYFLLTCVIHRMKYSTARRKKITTEEDELKDGKQELINQ